MEREKGRANNPPLPAEGTACYASPLANRLASQPARPPARLLTATAHWRTSRAFYQPLDSPPLTTMGVLGCT